MLDGQVAFITGATRGIGWATAKLFARRGATVVINGRSDRALLDERVAELRETAGTDCHGIVGDMSQPGDVRACYQEIFKRFKRLDVLVNNAGILRDGLLGMISDASVEEVLGVNTIGALHNVQEASRLMRRRRSGSIVNVTSIIGVRGGVEGQALYAASKAAVIGLTLSAAKELAPNNIRVNAVAPGLIATDMLKQVPERKLQERLAGVRMGRIGEPDDVAQVILFFASDMSSYVTGQVLGVDGGMTI